MGFTTRRITVVLAAASVIGLICGGPVSAFAQGVALDDDEDLGPSTAEEESFQDESGAQLGLGVRVRQVHVLESMLELFFGDVPGSTSHIGFGAELIRQKGNFALTLGIEYEQLSAAEGLWLEKGEENELDPDFVEFDDFAWIAADVNFIWRSDLTSMFSIRYGVGLGVGLILGEVLRTDHRCASAELSLDNCPVDADGRMRFVEDDIPPVFPVVNMIVGAQFRPIANLAVNLEGGIRSVTPFVGTSVAYLF